MKLLEAISEQCNTITTIGHQNAPTLLIAIGLCSVAAAVGLAIKATPHAAEAKKEVDNEITEETPKKEAIVKTAKAVVPYYIPTLAAFVLGAACIIGANNIQLDRLATATTAYRLSEQALREHREKTIEMFGEKKERQIRDEIAKDHIKKNPIKEDKVMEAQTGTSLFMDSLSGRYFRANRDQVMRAYASFIRRLYSCSEMYMSVNEWYEFLKDEDIKIEIIYNELWNKLGWNVDSKMDIYFSVQKAANDEACTVIEYNIPPTYDYKKINEPRYWFS